MVFENRYIKTKLSEKSVLDYSTLEKYDGDGMYKVYDNWPKTAREAYESEFVPVNFDNIDHIVFSGMGGSGAVGDLISAILSKTDIHVTVVKGYLLPKTVDSNTLVVITSISGNTRETLSTLESAQKLNCKKIAFSSGGKIESFCLENEIEFRKIPILHSPRASFCTYVYSILRVLNSIIPIKRQDIVDSLDKLEDMSKKISSSNLTESNPSLSLAKWITGIPLIYYPFGLQAAAIRFKNALQENAKSHAMVEDVIEACHNGIVAWQKPSNVKPVLLEGKDDYIKTKERWKIIKEFFETKKIDYWEVTSIEGNILSKLLTMIYLLDYASIYLAVLSKTDPTPIKAIDFIKSRLE